MALEYQEPKEPGTVDPRGVTFAIMMCALRDRIVEATRGMADGDDPDVSITLDAKNYSSDTIRIYAVESGDADWLEVGSISLYEEYSIMGVVEVIREGNDGDEALARLADYVRAISRLIRDNDHTLGSGIAGSVTATFKYNVNTLPAGQEVAGFCAQAQFRVPVSTIISIPQ